MAIKANLVVDQGTTFVTTINLIDNNDAPIDLTTFTAQAQLRKHYTSSNSTNISIDLSEGSNGVIILSMNANTTANLNFGRYVYDVEIVSPSGAITRVVEGIVTVTPNVTR